jgi:hypothetical protein
VETTDQDRREVAEPRRAEPWFADAFAAYERIWAGGAASADWAAITLFNGVMGRGRASAQEESLRMATTEQMHRVIAPEVRIEQTRRRLARQRAE